MRFRTVLGMLLVAAVLTYNNSQVEPFKKTQQLSYHTFPIKGTITDVTAFWFHEFMRTKTENDVIIMIIESPGGMVTGMESIINDLDNTKATTIAYVDAYAGSAAANITAFTDYKLVHPRTIVLYHAAAMNLGGYLNGVHRVNLFTIPTNLYWGARLIKPLTVYEALTFVVNPNILRVISGSEFKTLTDNVILVGK